MVFIKEIKQKIGNYLLKRRLRNFARQREWKNLGKCRSVLILSSSIDDLEAADTVRLISYFKQLNKEVCSLHYLGERKTEAKAQVADMKTFSTLHLNKVNIPKEAFIQDLVDRDFDLFIDLSLGEAFPLKYIHAMSKSKLKVGASMNYKMHFADFTIDISKNQTVTYLITQLKYYLTQINQDQHVTQF